MKINLQTLPVLSEHLFQWITLGLLALLTLSALSILFILTIRSFRPFVLINEQHPLNQELSPEEFLEAILSEANERGEEFTNIIAQFYKNEDKNSGPTILSFEDYFKK